LDLFIPDIYVNSLNDYILVAFNRFLDTMDTGNIITELRKQKNWSQTDLATKSGLSRVMIGKYERGEASPSIDAAKKMADAFEVSLDYLAGKTSIELSESTLSRLREVTQLPSEEQNQIFKVMDALVRDYKAKLAYGA
jgi:transcriptional regulator with XRE-family HTH domain